jgi:hypothetical protein
MRSPENKKNTTQSQVTTKSSTLSTPMADAIDLLFTDDRIFASLTKWIEQDLARLEQHFADYHSSEAHTPTRP